MSKPKVVVVGAGSLFFGRKAIWAMNHLPGLRGGTLALVDTDPERLDKMARLANLSAKASGSNVKVEACADHRDAMEGANYVVLSFSRNNCHYRRIDCQIAAKYGVRMCSGDTIGPGGMFRTLRDFPKILEVARAVEELAPDAWVINYINPSAIMGIGLARHTNLKTFALCDSHHMPFKKEAYLDLIGESPARLPELDMRIAGVNHFTWMLKAELQGVDILPRIREAFWNASHGEKDTGYAKARFNNFITAQLGDLFGGVPTCTGHTKEYVPFYQGRSAIQEPIPPLSVFDCDERDKRTATMWEEVDLILSGKTPLSEFHKNTKSDHATDIINTMETGDGRTYFINRTNTDCNEGGSPVGNMPPDAFLELECALDANGPRPRPVGNMPPGLRSLQTLILDCHELTIEAIMKRDRNLLLRALSIDPLVNSIATANTLIEELYLAQKDVLGDWVGEKSGRDFNPTTAAESANTPQLF